MCDPPEMAAVEGLQLLVCFRAGDEIRGLDSEELRER